MAEEDKKENDAAKEPHVSDAPDASHAAPTAGAVDREGDVSGDSDVSDKSEAAPDAAQEPHVSDAPDASHAPESSEPPEPSEPSKPSKPSKPGPAEPDWKTLYALTLADFDNYKKRAARDREDTYRYAEADILKDVLPAVDNLQLALANAKEKSDDPFVKGVQLVHDTLLKALKDHGAEPFDCVGEALDTEKMEAIAHLPHEEIPEGKVSIESKKGWMLKDKVLRAAQVVVSSGKAK